MLSVNNISNSVKIQQLNLNTVKEKEDKKIATGVKIEENSAELKISHNKMRSEEEIEKIAKENLSAAFGDINDVLKAEEMINKANMKIRNNSNEAVLSQSNQDNQVVMTLLN